MPNRRPRPLALLLTLTLGAVPALLLPACDGGAGDPVNGAGPPAVGSAPAEIEREIRDLISAVSPLPATATAFQEIDWSDRRRETLKRLRQGPPELGAAALEAYEARSDALVVVRSALLDVAAHCDPESARPILIELVQTYGPDLGLRKNAALYLAQTSPAQATELLEPIVLGREGGATYPPMDQLLEAWVLAMDLEQLDATEVLTLVVTDISMEPASRHRAAKELGKRPSAAGRQALETVLVESLGNDLLRRFAAQSLQSTLTAEELCPVLERVFENESNINMQQFLASMLEENCL